MQNFYKPPHISNFYGCERVFHSAHTFTLLGCTIVPTGWQVLAHPPIQQAPPTPTPPPCPPLNLPHFAHPSPPHGPPPFRPSPPANLPQKSPTAISSCTASSASASQTSSSQAIRRLSHRARPAVWRRRCPSRAGPPGLPHDSTDPRTGILARARRVVRQHPSQAAARACSGLTARFDPGPSERVSRGPGPGSGGPTRPAVPSRREPPPS